MTALTQFDPVPTIQLPTIWIGLLWGINITFLNPDASVAQLSGYTANLLVNSHEGAGATNLVTWDATGGYFTLGNTAPNNIQIEVDPASTRVLSPHKGGYAYFTITDGSGHSYLFFKGPVDIAYGGA